MKYFLVKLSIFSFILLVNGQFSRFGDSSNSNRAISFKSFQNSNRGGVIGDKCDKNEDWCNYSKWTYCRRGICDCLHPQRQIYDLGKNRCAGVVGTECNVYIGERDCISNAVCQFNRESGQSLCQCKPGFKSNSGRRCVSDLNYNGSNAPTKEIPAYKPREFDYSSFTIINNAEKPTPAPFRPISSQDYLYALGFLRRLSSLINS